MRVLLKEGAEKATAATILVLPQLEGSAFETLSGEDVPRGVVAAADEKTLSAAIKAGVEKRGNDYVDTKALVKGIQWMDKALADYEQSSKIGLDVSKRGYALEDSEATPINRAEGLTEGDTVAIVPRISPKALMNARGRFLSIDGDKVEIELEAGDRDRFQRATGKRAAEHMTFYVGYLEKD
jgi:hypothetical protein